MRTCYQHAHQNMLEHGLAVEAAFLSLVDSLAKGVAPDGFRVSEWLVAGWSVFENKLLHRDVISRYQRYHDCGKPRCRTIDENGRQHFPGHAIHSEAVWLEAGGDAAAGRLIGLDMVVHEMFAAEILSFALIPESATLWLTALSEIHANAVLFGGMDTVSFKSKWKHIDRRGKALLLAWTVNS
jgi:hypothetical protein